jgi:5-methylthioadenosine/S-adenosylhomocysteine deaminase
MISVDTLLLCRWLIPVVPRGIIHEHYALAIKNGRIEAILPKDKVRTAYFAAEQVELNHHALLPGFINAHTHSPMTLFRGLADDLSLMEWLNDHIWPAERKWLNEEFIADGTKIAIAEMIKTGTTCFNEHFFFPEIIAQVALENKIRACIGPTLINFPTNWSQHEKEAFEKFLIAKESFDLSPLLTWSLAPHSPYGTTDSLLKKIAHYSDQHHLAVHMHLHETKQEIAESEKQYGKRPLQRLYELGLLNPRFQAVHMTQINEEDLRLMKETGIHVIHCPESNLKLASGYCPVDRLLKTGINVSLGTDGAASNNDLDMIGEMRTAALIGKSIANTPTAVPAVEAIEMATINGAKAMGLCDKIGSLEVGKSADIIAIDLEQINTLPIYNPLSQIVYSAVNRQVTDAWVAGNQLLANGKLTLLDEEELKHAARKWHGRINHKRQKTN